MFKFDYTLSGIAKFNAIKDSTETRVAVLGTVLGSDCMYSWYEEQLTKLWECHRENGICMEYLCKIKDIDGRMEFSSLGMLTDGHLGVCEDHDVRCIRFWRMKKNGEKIYGDCGRLFKKKAGSFMREIIKDSGIEYDDNQKNYICTRFAVEWMEARISEFGIGCLSEGINEYVATEAALDVFNNGTSVSEYDGDEQEDIMAEVMVLRSGTMMCGTPTGQRVHVEADRPWVIAIHGECDCGTYNYAKICSSETEARGLLEKYWNDKADSYHIEKNNIIWDREGCSGTYRDMCITKLADSFSIFKGYCGSLNFVHVWIQQSN